MVAAEQEEVLRVLDLVRQQEADGLDGLAAAVDVVAEEEVVGVRGVADLVEVAEEVGELAVDVAHDVDGGLELQEHGLLQEDLPRDHAQLADLVLREAGLKRNENIMLSHRCLLRSIL